MSFLQRCAIFAALVLGIFTFAFLIDRDKKTAKSFHENPKTVVIDGCEYLIFQDPNSYDKFSVTHKGNCSSSSHKSHP